MSESGRPLLFKDEKILQEKIDDYFKQMDKEKRPYTITGLAVHLDTSRNTLLNYEKKEQFFSTIKRAKEKIEQYAEEQLFTNRNTAGVIFNMVNNWSWKNKQDIDASVKSEVKIIDDIEEDE